MIATIRGEKDYHSERGGWRTRQDVAAQLNLADGSHIDRVMAGYPVLMLPRKDGKSARMYHRSDVNDAVQKRHKQAKHAPELFTAATMRKTARDKRKAQQGADIKTMMNMEEPKGTK